MKRKERPKKIRDRRKEHNREVFELWLITRSMRLSTRPKEHPDTYHGNVNKPHSSPNQDLTWIEAIFAPDCQATDRYLTRALKELEAWEPDAFATLYRVYLGTNADEALPEQWRAVKDDPTKKWSLRASRAMLLHLLEDAFTFVLYRAHRDRMLFIWPSPERAKGMVKANEHKRRDARYFYVRAREDGKTVTAAVRAAYLSAKCSEQAVWKWRNTEGWEGLVDTTKSVREATSGVCKYCGSPRIMTNAHP